MEKEKKPIMLKMESSLVMGKGKKLKMEKGGPSQKAELESSPKLKKIALYCSYPHSSSNYIDFEATAGYCDNRRNYHLVSDHGNHILHRHNPEKKFVLTHKGYKSTLKQWLEHKENSNNWCPTYEDWKVCRPKDVARQIIQGILRAVYELHNNDSFHGFLYHPENFAICFEESVIGGDCQNIKYIFLTHDNVKPDSSFGVPEKNNLREGKKKDISALVNVIFRKILVGPLLSYPVKQKGLQGYLKELPEDLQDLHRLLKKRDMKLDDWKFIVNHPSLWHWKSRFSYFDRVYMQYRHANHNTQVSMDIIFKGIDVGDWTSRIREFTPLENIYRRNGFSETTYELLRYLRIVHSHYVDGRKERDGVYRPYVNRRTETEYLDPQYIENITTKVSKLFLVKLYKEMCVLEIDIKEAERFLFQCCG